MNRHTSPEHSLHVILLQILPSSLAITLLQGVETPLARFTQIPGRDYNLEINHCLVPAEAAVTQLNESRLNSELKKAEAAL